MVIIFSKIRRRVARMTMTRITTMRTMTRATMMTAMMRMKSTQGHHPPSNKKRKYNTITLEDEDNIAKSKMAKSYPHLLQALGVGEDGFDPTSPSAQKSMRSLLSELNNLLSTTYQLDVNRLSNKRISYV